LANLYEREKSLEKCVGMLKLLSENELDPDKNRDHRLRLAGTFEARGDLRGAESILERTRRNAPVDLVVLKSMANLYRRQKAPQALSMHLNRAVADFRQAIATDSRDSAAWVGLTEVLEWHGRKDAARVVASSAFTLGIRSDQLSELVDGYGGVPGVGSRAADDEIDEHLGSQTIPRAARAIFQMAHEVFDKTLPFDERSVKAEKVSARNNEFLAAGKSIADWFGVPEPRVLTTAFLPSICVPVSASPFVVLVGANIYSSADEREKRFLLARAAKIVRSNLVVAARSQPMDLALTIAGLIRSYDPNYAPPELDQDRLDEVTRRVGRALSRKLRNPLQPLVMEMAGVSGFDATKLGLLACELGDRAALLATGSVPAAVGALMHLAGRSDLPELRTKQRLVAIEGVPEAQDLFDFALSDLHFDARRRAGAEDA
ncbi:MAG: hypothetical protein JRH11_22455, partial [Deltaproteobacteria bacterium]|nr:hypothetical protein [Deltaproteobacteria bacterium]